MERQARRALLMDSLAPVTVSVLLVLTVGPALPALLGWAVVLLWPAAVVAALPPVGERWLATVIWGARRATPAEQLTMSVPVRRADLEERLHVAGLRIRLVPGGDVRAYGAGTILLGRDVVAQVRHRRLSSEQAAARLGHQMGLLRSGATRWEPVTQVLALPWHVLASVRLPLLTPMLRAGWWLRGLYVPVLAFLAWQERDPFHLAAIAVLVLTYLTPRWHQAWLAARLRIADAAIARTSLARPFVDWLLQVDGSAAMYERVYALATSGTSLPARPGVPAGQPWW